MSPPLSRGRWTALMAAAVVAAVVVFTTLQWRWSVEAQLAAQLRLEADQALQWRKKTASTISDEVHHAVAPLTETLRALHRRQVALTDNASAEVRALRAQIEAVVAKQFELTTSMKQPGPGPGPHHAPPDTINAELVAAIEVLESAIAQVQSTHLSRLYPKGHFETQPFRYCQLACNGRGLSVKIPNITRGCECSCTGGWRGAACQRPPDNRFYVAQSRASSEGAVPLVGVVPPVVIPLERDELPTAESLSLSAEKREALETCRNASIAYFLERHARDEFRGDRGVDFFWKLAVGALPPYCSSATERVAIVDVGAHVGERRSLWEHLLIDASGDHRCAAQKPDAARWNDSVVLLVEPNPLNLVVLRQSGSRDTPPSASGNRNPPKSGSSNPRGVVGVVEVAALHYDGVGMFVVDLAANRNKKVNGNERGYVALSLEESPPESTPSVRHIPVAVRTVSTIVHEAHQLPPMDASKRPITTISVLKIDAEGMDALVLYGAAEILAITRVVVFECHKLWSERGRSWNQSDKGTGNVRWFRLREAAEFLTKHGFDVYKVGVYYWLPITPPFLWSDVYEEHMQWSNCVALRRPSTADEEPHPLRRVFSTPPSCGSVA